MRLMSAALMLSLAACAPSPGAENGQAAAPEAATPGAEAPALPDQPPIVGGYGPADLENEWVKAAQAVAVEEIKKRDPEAAAVASVEVQQQVVAGMNYRFAITTEGGATYSVTVYRNLDGEMEVTDYAKS